MLHCLSLAGHYCWYKCSLASSLKANTRAPVENVVSLETGLVVILNVTNTNGLCAAKLCFLPQYYHV